MKKQKAKNLTANIVTGILAAALLSYVIYQIVMATTAPYKTVLAAISSVSDDVPALGVAVRSETPLENDSAQAYDYRITDGEMVGKGAVIANIYNSPSAARQVAMLEQLESERNFLIKLQNSASSSTNLSDTRSAMTDALSKLALSVSDNRVKNVADTLHKSESEVASYYLQTQRETNYAARIAELNELINSIKASASSPSGNLTAPQAGYFVTSVDGFEQLVNTDSVMDMSVSDIEALINTQPKVSETPKLVDSYVWKYAAVVNAKYASRFREGQQLTIDFKYAGVTDLPVTVIKVSDETDGKILVIFSVEYFNKNTASLRVADASISFRNYSGIIVPRSALRIQDGVLGVFIKFGNVVRFVKVNIIFETDTYVLADGSSTSQDELRLYDEIITEGKNLYVGKELS